MPPAEDGQTLGGQHFLFWLGFYFMEQDADLKKLGFSSSQPLCGKEMVELGLEKNLMQSGIINGKWPYRSATHHFYVQRWPGIAWKRWPEYCRDSGFSFTCGIADHSKSAFLCQWTWHEDRIPAAAQRKLDTPPMGTCTISYLQGHRKWHTYWWQPGLFNWLCTGFLWLYRGFHSLRSEYGYQ